MIYQLVVIGKERGLSSLGSLLERSYRRIQLLLLKYHSSRRRSLSRETSSLNRLLCVKLMVEQRMGARSKLPRPSNLELNERIVSRRLLRRLDHSRYYQQRGGKEIVLIKEEIKDRGQSLLHLVE